MAAAARHKEPTCRTLRQVSTYFVLRAAPPSGTSRQQAAIGQSNEIYQYGNGKLKRRKQKAKRNENVEGAEGNRRGVSESRSRAGWGGMVRDV